MRNGQLGPNRQGLSSHTKCHLQQLQQAKLHLSDHRLRVSPPAAQVALCPGGSAEPSVWIVHLDSEFCLCRVPLPTLSRKV